MCQKQYWGIIFIVAWSITQPLYPLKGALWENFKNKTEIYKQNKTEDNAQKLLNAYDNLIKASSKEASQAWKDNALSQISDFYVENPEYFEAFFIERLDTVCRVPELLARRLRRKLLKSK